MSYKQDRVLKLPYKDIEGAYIIVSFSFKEYDNSEPFLDYVISFFFDAGHQGAEWEPKFGPIQLFTPCDSETEGALEHYFYDYIIPRPMAWSQMSVYIEGLKQAAVLGNYDHIFAVLRRWAER